MNDDLHRTVPALEWGVATHVGRVRDSNEDAYVADPMVFAVADGMGGHQAGEVASAIAANTLRERLGSGAPSSAVVEAAVVEANAAIFAGAHSNPAQRGMGTTVTGVAVLVEDDGRLRLAVLNVGDSRTYVLRSGSLRRVTVDHSYVQELVDTGHITEAEARRHPRRNIVTRALGIEPSVRVDVKVVPFVRGDRYVICSDGLVDEVDDDEILEILLEQSAPQDAADELVAAALRNGGRDNVTVIVLDSIEGEEPPTADADLGIEPTWGAATAEVPVTATASTAASTAVLPVTTDASNAVAGDAATVGAAEPTGGTAVRVPWRPTLGVALFSLAAAVIVMFAVVFLLVAGDSDEVPTPSTVTTVLPTTSVHPTTTIHRSVSSASTTDSTSTGG